MGVGGGVSHTLHRPAFVCFAKERERKREGMGEREKGREKEGKRVGEGGEK